MNVLCKQGRCDMSLSSEIRDIRQNCFLSQKDFSEALSVSFSTVNRWETGKSIPNCGMMRKISQFCKQNGIDSTAVDNAWKEVKNSNVER